MTLQASLGAQCVEMYQLNYLSGGLVYIPSGVAGGFAVYMTGRRYHGLSPLLRNADNAHREVA